MAVLPLWVVSKAQSFGLASGSRELMPPTRTCSYHLLSLNNPLCQPQIMHEPSPSPPLTPLRPNTG